MKKFTLHIPEDIEAQIRKYRASLRRSIHERLQEIVDRLVARRVALKKIVEVEGPPHRFYVFEGCRVSYRVDPVTRRVVVLTISPETA